MSTNELTLTDIIKRLNKMRQESVDIIEQDSNDDGVTAIMDAQREIAGFDQAIGSLTIINIDIWNN